MPQLGDVLRGLGSVLNPAVAQDVAQEDARRQAQDQQLRMIALQQLIQRGSPEYQAKMEALQNERNFRTAAQAAGGDPVKLAAAAAQYGKPELAVSLYNQQEARAARLQQAKEANDMKFLQLQQAGTNAEAMQELKRQGLALQAEIAKGNQDLKRMQFGMQQDNQLKKQTQQLGAALEKANLPEADAVLDGVEQALQKSPQIAEYISGPKSAIPDWMVPDDVKFGRQAFQKLFNITLKTRSGSAVTNQELERLKSEFAAGTFKTPQQLQAAVDQARNIINKHYQSVASGYGKEALDSYNENLRGFGGRVVLSGGKQEDPLGIR